LFKSLPEMCRPLPEVWYAHRAATERQELGSDGLDQRCWDGSREGRDGRRSWACCGTPHVREGRLRPRANSRTLQEAVAQSSSSDWSAGAGVLRDSGLFLFMPLFTGVRGRGILRTSPLRSSTKFSPAQVLRMASSCELAEQGSEYGPYAAAQQNASGDYQENAVEDTFALSVFLVPVVERQKSAEQRNAAP
jgi:hypothetical protein